MKKKIAFIAFSIFLFCFLIFYFFPNFLSALESKIFDEFTVVAKSISYLYPKAYSSSHRDDVIIVALDEATIQKLHKKVPYPRYVYVDLLNKIYKGDPKLVIFDLIFSGESEDKKSDILFAKAVGGKDNILFPYVLGKSGESLKSDISIVKDFMPAGYLNKPIDTDSEIRRMTPFNLAADNKIGDYATELHIFSRYYNYGLGSIALNKKRVSINQLQSGKKGRFKKSVFSLRKDNTVLINYQANTVDLLKIPMWAVLSDNFDPSVFKDKIVFIGVTAMVFHDMHRTPFGYMAGMEIMINAALMFLDGKFIEEPSEWIKWLLNFIFCMLAVFLCYRLSIFKGFLLVASSVSILVGVAFWMFLNNQYFFNPFKLVLISIISYTVINFYKHAYVVLENIQLRKLSTTDELTGLHTFRFFSIVINHEFQKCLRYKTPLSLLMIDIDNFKKINDTYGHQKGNVVLIKIGKILLNSLRKADFSTRYGGEELAIILPNSNLEGAYKCAENIRQIIENEEYFMAKQGPLKVTVSIGVASYPAINISSAEDMIKLADTALYKAKQQGKNRVIVYSEEEA